MVSLFSFAELHKDVKCCFCAKFLSVPPIFHGGFGSICGRCTFINENKETAEWKRQVTYEEFAQHFSFPCSNMSFGCKAELKWGNVEDHENTCLYKKLGCPLSEGEFFETQKCNWVGSGPSLNEHIETAHSDLIKKLPEVDFSNLKSDLILFTRTAKQLMIIIIKFQAPNKYLCLVMTNGASANCDDYCYQLELHDNERKNSIILRRNRVEDAVALQECLMDPDKMLIIELPIMEEFLKNPAKIMGRFGILRKSKKKIASTSQHVNHFDENFLLELECPICKCYLTPPIVICSGGHSFCDKCRVRLAECPTCRKPFQGGRNYTLEKVAGCVNFPCVYREAGCYASLNCQNIRKHEMDCSFAGAKCFFETCATASPKSNMFLHLTTVHKEAMIVPGELQILDVSGETQSLFCYAICFGNDIFRLTVECGDDEEPIRFALQQFGVAESSYMYEVEIIYSTDSTQRLTVTSECQVLGTTDCLLENCVIIPNEMVCEYVTQESLIFFKIHLRKN